MRSVRFAFAFLFLSFSQVSCAAQTATSDVAPVPVASAADPAGRMQGFQQARRYADVARIDGKDVRRTVEYGFDYGRHGTVRRDYDENDRLIGDELQPNVTLRANAAEEARLVELVRTHPQLASAMAEPGLIVHAGGFVLQEPGHPHCDAGSRCIRVVVSKGDGSIRHVYALVDLVSDRVIEPFHVPSQPGAPGLKKH
jgi:hypothetical protein